jgi:hypothetical protein
MKTSNKILLTLFVAAFLILTAIHVALYARYKSGKMVIQAGTTLYPFKPEELRNIRYVSITGLAHCTIIPADTAKVQAWRENDSHLLFRIVKDTLVIYGDSSIRLQRYQQGLRAYEQVVLYLPEMKQISGSFCQIYLAGGTDTATAPGYNLHLVDHAAVSTQEIERKEKQYFSTLNIRAQKSSEIDFDPAAVIGNLDIALEESMINDHSATIHNLQLIVDDKSEVILHGANLKKINLIPKQ